MKHDTHDPPALSAIVLCGGASTRMGTHKAALNLGRETLLERTVRIVNNVAVDVVVVDHPGRHAFAVPSAARVAYDHEPDLGPLAGLLAGLRSAKHEVAYVTSCDAPFLRESFVRTVVDALGTNAVAMPEVDGFAQPLAAAYRTGTQSAIARMLQTGERRPRRIRAHVSHSVVAETMLRTVDPTLESLINVNSPQDLETATTRHTSRPRPRLVIELFEMARRHAGVHRVDLEATTLRDGLAQLAAMHPRLQRDVLLRDGSLATHWRLLRGDRALIDDIDLDVADGETVALLSALAGG